MTYHLLVKTRQRDESVEVVGEMLDTLVVKTKEAPHDGKANISVIALVAEYLGVAKRRVTIKSGAHSKTKTVTISPA